MFEKRVKVKIINYCRDCGELIGSENTTMKEKKLEELKDKGELDIKDYLYDCSFRAVIEQDNKICKSCQSNNLRSVIFL